MTVPKRTAPSPHISTDDRLHLLDRIDRHFQHEPGVALGEQDDRFIHLAEAGQRDVDAQSARERHLRQRDGQTPLAQIVTTADESLADDLMHRCKDLRGPIEIDAGNVGTHGA